MSKPRIDVPNIPFHVFARGNNRLPIFLDDFDRVVFFKYWKEAKERFDFRLFTYALMDNHFHFLIQMELESSLSELMHYVQFQFARYMNKKYTRVGHLFQGRFNSIPVETDSYFLTVDRYIHLNPVKAGLILMPEDYRWSSYKERFLLNQNDDWIDHSMALSFFGGSPGNREAQLSSYKRFTNEGIGRPEEWTLDQLSKMSFLGSVEFYKRILNQHQTKLITL